MATEPSANTIPTFETERLILRQVSLADIPSYEKHFNDYEVVRNLFAVIPWPPQEGNGIREFLHDVIFPQLGKTRWMWGIFEKSNPDELIGVVDIWKNKDTGHGNRGFWLGRAHWRKGYMTEAVMCVMDYAFNELEFKSFLLNNAKGNIASRKIKENIGARYLGTEPTKFIDPAFTEKEKWELTKEIWQKYRQNGK